MNYPKIPKNLANTTPDYFKMTFEFIPQLLKYYAIQGKNLTQIKKQFDFQEALFIIKQGQNKDLIDHWVLSWWGNLVYFWIYQDDMMLKIIDLVKSKTDDEWWEYKGIAGAPIKKDIRAHMTDMFGEDMATQIILSIHGMATSHNQILGLEHVEMGGTINYPRYANLGDTERSRLLGYLLILDNLFKNYQETLEENYLEETPVLLKAWKVV